MRQPLYVSVGEFAKICGISRQTLIYYDKIHLFSPDVVEDNGYRYYNISQLDIIVTIQSLQSIGLSLDEIKAYLQNRTGSLTYQLFTKKICEMEEGTAQLMRKIDMLRTKSAAS